MPSMKRYLELDANSRQSFKYLIHILTSMNAVVKTAVDGFINAVHGSYNAFHPKNAKKHINIIIRNNDGKSSIEISIDYTNYVIYTAFFTVVYFVIGSILFYQAVSSIEYLSEFESNPFIVLVKEEPWLLHLLSNYFEDLKSIKNILVIMEFVSIAFLISGVIGIIYMIVTPIFINSFADELVSRITTSTMIQTIPENRVQPRLSEKGKWNETKESIKSEIYNIFCKRSSENVILCSIEGKKLSPEDIGRALEFLGFRITKSSTGVIMGENSGSFLADKFPSKKMRVRAVINCDGNNAEIIFETSIWIGFSKKDCLEAETLLKKVLLSIEE